MIISLPLAATADDCENLVIPLIKQNAKQEGQQLTEDEIDDWVNKLCEPPIDLPMTHCWASSVESYNPGYPRPWPQFTDPLQILGEDNANDIDHTKSVSLGNTLDENGPYGEITVSFGAPFPALPRGRLYLYEVGTDNENVYLQVRRADTGTYHPADPGLLVTTDFPFTTIQFSQFGVPDGVKLNAVRIRDALDGNIGAAAAGADIDAISTDVECSTLATLPTPSTPRLAVEIQSIEANLIEEGVAILWKTGQMNNVAQLHLMRVPIMVNGQLDKEQAVVISKKKPFWTKAYGALEKSLPPPGQYAYVVKEITDSGKFIWHDNGDRGEMAIIEIPNFNDY
jgi:hypothetical protein